MIAQLHFVTEKPLMFMETTAHSKQQFAFTEVVKKKKNSLASNLLNTSVNGDVILQNWNFKYALKTLV